MRAAALTALALVTTALGAAAAPPAVAHGAGSVERATTQRVTLHADRNVTEGHRFAVTIRLTSPRQVGRVRIFEQQTDVLGNTSWALAKSLHPRGYGTVKVRLTAMQGSTERTRAVASYTSGTNVRSNSARTLVWSWTPLTLFGAYYKTPGVGVDFMSYAINGTEYPAGWDAYGTYPSWETRHTLGHHCRAFRGTLGLTDDSADGASATIAFSADGTEPLFTSSTLTPGMDQPVRFTFDRIYRLWIHFTNTSPDATTTDDIATLPAIGDGELLCTGVS